MVEKKNLLIADNTTALLSPWKNDIRTYFNCIEVIGAFEAQLKLKSLTISAIVINLSIQSFNGLDVVLKIREKDKNIPMIVIADKNDLRFVKNASQYGITAYFLFPFNGEDLLNALVKATGISIAQIINDMSAEQEIKEAKKAAANNNNNNKLGEDGDIPALFYQGQSFLVNEDIDNAMNAFQQVVNTKAVKDSCRRYWEESIFQLARCLMKKTQFNEAIEKFNLFMQRAPNSDLNKQAYFLIGESYEKMNDIPKAIQVFNKLINMPPMDSISTKARKKVTALQEKKQV